MKMNPVTVTFKNKAEEIALYKIINKHTSRSTFIKDILIAVLVNKNYDGREI